MSGYKLTPAAQEDLLAIRDEYLRDAGYRAARQVLEDLGEAFRAVARTPTSGHKRVDVAEYRPTLFWPVKGFVILYKPGSAPLQILAVARGSRDVPSVITREDEALTDGSRSQST